MTVDPVDPVEPRRERVDLDRMMAQGDLTVEVVGLLRHSIDRNSRIQKWSLAVAALVMVILALVVIDNRLQLQHLQQQFCPLVTLQVPRPGEAGSSTQHGKDVERYSRELAARFHCSLSSTSNVR